MASAPLKNVAIVGGSGNLGKYVLNELLHAGFHVTALSREDSSATFPDGVTVKKVDYSSKEAVKDALAGQDAVVSTIATLAIGNQPIIADAAFEVGVKRFIPSEFGVNTRKLDVDGLKKMLAFKINLVDDLQKKAAANPAFSWTGISTGLFFDFGLKSGYLPFDLKTKTATIYDSGNEPSSNSNLDFIGKAVVSVLQHPQETANKYLTVASFTPSQNEILQIIEEETGTKWNIKHVNTADLEKIGNEKLANGDFSAFRDFLRAHLYGDGRGNAPKGDNNANGLLGLPTGDLRGTIRNWLSEAGAL